MPDGRERRRVTAFAVIVVACLAAAGVYVGFAADRSETEAVPPAVGEGLLQSGGGARVLIQHVKRDARYAQLAVAPARPGARRQFLGLVCERAHFAAGRGLCLKARQGITSSEYEVTIFDRAGRPGRKLTVPGIASRARVSPDGRYGSTTGFVNGHSYADAGQFSTHTTLIDLESGRQIADLEQFKVTRDGVVVDAEDRNFWGVTFARGERFYATMATGGQTYLVEGDIAARTMRTLRRNVECPSLSPDGRRIAYKRRVDDGDVVWRLHILDLDTGKDIGLAERRMVDDQAEWLDDGRIAYGLGGDVWTVPADGSGTPERLQAGALSPAAIR